MIAPVAPHIGEELWSKLGYNETITYASWPTFDESKLVEDEVEIVVQVMGKVRAKLTMSKDASKDEMEKLALEAIQDQIEGKTVRKVIVVPENLLTLLQTNAFQIKAQSIYALSFCVENNFWITFI